eukprot:CAMPEP_0178447518 /NCGR_PEP_ID=MMETSP0689_2-20121128/41447_1 /TAXON_ID=160604 /ORGANISM="Amphidinium massartii, Strain CS-259" /LENGTH=67 /DNA_ID=CAMNT_0020072549 /DNA_START=461 /DNA_END=660 /DNA_ORIENTATION=+
MLLLMLEEVDAATQLCVEEALECLQWRFAGFPRAFCLVPGKRQLGRHSFSSASYTASSARTDVLTSR